MRSWLENWPKAYNNFFRLINVKSIESEEMIMTMTMTKTLITTVIMKVVITIIMMMRIKIGKSIKIYQCKID